MQKYREAVADIAARGADNLLHNEGNEHAVIIFENLFKNARDCVRIAARDLCNDEVTNQMSYRNSLEDFLERDNAKLKVFLRHYNSEYIESHEKNNLFDLIKKTRAYREGRVEIREMLPGNAFTIKGAEVHFATADSHAYRLENDVVARKALCNFGDKEMTQRLEKGFDAFYTDEYSRVIAI